MAYIPHTPADTETMLAELGISSINELFAEIPRDIRNQDELNIPEGCSEMEMLQRANDLAKANLKAACFLGGGSYDHHIPAAVWDIATRGEFLTAYTPYQAEASQGTLQLLYEFQTMIAEITGMDVANASLYDGATALAEAILMAIRLKPEKSETTQILLPSTLHPHYQQTIKTLVGAHPVEIILLPFCPKKGITLIEKLTDYESESTAALVIAQPNFFGCLEDVDALTNWAKEHNIISIGCVNPMSLGILKAPGQWGIDGVDVVCGEGQPLGIPMASGGPYLGFLSTRLKNVRQMPGRIVGRTIDAEGKPGFTLTLQAREQHIRRAKATSNICTNQGLLVTAATIYMSLLGPHGLSNTASLCHQNTRELITKLTSLPGVKRTFSTPFFHECVLSFAKPIEPILEELLKQNIAGGLPLAKYYPSLSNELLVCVTEKRTMEEIGQYVEVLKTIPHPER